MVTVFPTVTRTVTVMPASQPVAGGGADLPIAEACTLMICTAAAILAGAAGLFLRRRGA
ncbi:MAG: hypothetical protein HOV96_00170 [Nonomuraea sp.]|nr:hypothetical protein [Nonomuraea sp.]NUP75950.1 hypothetical protein [Nonomuraea sp.]